MLTFPKPASVHGDALTAELAAAGFPDAQVSDDGQGHLEVAGVEGKDRDAVAAVLAAHAPPAPPADPDAELVAAITAATTLAQLKDALIGKGRSAVVAGRGKDR